MSGWIKYKYDIIRVSIYDVRKASYFIWRNYEADKLER